MPPPSDRGRPGPSRPVRAAPRGRTPERRAPGPRPHGPARSAVLAWSVLFALLVGWEFTGLAFGGRGWPTFSGVVRFFMSLPAGRWALYAGWIWLGWDLLPTEGAPLSGRPWASRVRRGLVIAAVLGYAWWAAFLRSEVRWVDVLVPAAGLLAIALFGHLRRSTPISSMARATRDWIELQLRRARR